MPPIRVESLGLGKVLVVPVNSPRADNHQRAARDRVSAYVVTLDRHATEQPGRRIQAHRFGEHHARVRQRLRIIGLWRPVPDDRVDFRVQARLDLRMARQQVPRPRKGICGRLVARQQHRRQFIAKLLVGHHVGAGRLLRAQQHRQQIDLSTPIAAAFLDDAGEHSIDRLARRAQPAHVRQRKKVHHGRQRQQRHFEQAAGGLQRFAGQCADIPPEQRFPRNRQGHPAHLSGDVEVVAVFQAIARIEGQRDHHVGVCGQLGLLKRGLDQPPLPAVQGAIARQHAVSEQAPRAPERLPLREAMLTGDEHLLDVVGMVEQEHAKRGEPDVHDVAVLGAEPLHEAQRIAAGFGEAAEEHAASRSRRKGGRHLTIVAEMIAIVLNPASGQMRRAGLREEIETLCRQAGLDADIRETRGPLDVCAATREALAKGPDAIVAGGGDGTISAVASVLAGQTVPLGVLPLGTLNHFAKDLDIPVDRPEGHRDYRGAPAAARRRRTRERSRVRQQLVDRRLPKHRRSPRATAGARPSKWTSLVLATLEVLRQDATCPSGWRPTTGGPCAHAVRVRRQQRIPGPGPPAGFPVEARRPTGVRLLCSAAANARSAEPPGACAVPSHRPRAGADVGGGERALDRHASDIEHQRGL